MSEGKSDAVVSTVAEVCHGPFREALGAVEEQLDEGIMTAVDDGRRAHREIASRIGLNDEAPPDWGERAERLLEYRRHLVSEVLAPLQASFGGNGPSAAIVSKLVDASRRAREAARSLPASMEDRWAADALAPRPSDDLGRRTRKLVARVVSPARKAGEERSVPVRAVAVHYLDDTLFPALNETATAGLREWAAWEREIELAWIEWGDAALPALVRSELPEETEESGESDGSEKDDDEDTVPWAEVGTAAEALDARLGTLIDDCPLPGLMEALSATLRGARDELQDDLAVAGSFVFDPSDTHRLEPDLSALEKMESVMVAWDRGVANRFRLYEALLAILAGATAVQRRLVYRVRERHLADAAVLPEVADELEDLAEGLPGTHEGARQELVEHLIGLEPRVQTALAPTATAIPPSSKVTDTVKVGADATVDALLSMVRQAPSALDFHPEAGRLPRPGGKVDSRTLALQDLARQAFDALRIERIRSSTEGLVDAIEAVRADVAELPEVFAFAFDAAQEELEEGAEGGEGRARELVEEALLSMAESLRNAHRSLHNAVRSAQARLASEVSEGSLGLVDRVAAGRMQARLLAAQSSLAELRAWAVDRWGPAVQSAARSLLARWKLLRRLASRGLRKGTEMVGTGAPKEEVSARTLRQLSNAEAVLADLPLVYQRLFTLSPLDDPSLLAARDGELADGWNRWQRWRQKEGIPLMVRGRPGSGITSLLNVLATRIAEDGGGVARLSLDRRITGEEALTGRLAALLGVDAVRSLDDLSRQLFDAPDDGIPDAVLLDNLEHLYLRVPGGTDLIERLLTLMAETEPRIFWIGGITSSAWQLIATAEPTAVSQVDVLEIEPLTGPELREAVTVRHRRSGLPLRFEEPDSNRRLLRQRLKRLRDREGYENLVADAFFDRLERTSSRHLRLALFQWLVAADFGQSDGVVLRVPDRPDFSILDSLALTQSFTLKAFLEHGTLNLEEHDRIFRLPRHESYQIFESLQNRQLIEPVRVDEGGTPARSEIEVDLRYHVRPLVVGAVISHLRGRNIFH